MSLPKPPLRQQPAKLLAFTPSSQPTDRAATMQRNVLAVCYAFNDFSKARRARLAHERDTQQAKRPKR